MRLILAVLALLILGSPAQATLLLHGGNTAGICQPPTTEGVQYAAPSTCTVTANSFNWTFGTIVGSGPNYHFLASGSGAFEFGDVMGRSGGNFNWRTTGVCGSIWSAYPTLGPVAGFGGSALNNFIDTTAGHGSAAFNSFQGAMNSAGTNGSLLAQPIPALYGTCWSTSILSNSTVPSGLTFNLASNFLMDGSFDIPSTATNIVIIGNADQTSSIHGQTRFRDGSLNPTVKQVNISPNSTGSCGPAGTASGVLTGNSGIGTVTISHVSVNGCGAGGATQDHGIYISSENANLVNNVQMDNTTVLNTQAGGWFIKMRPGGQNTTNTLTNIIGATDGTISSNVNGAIDMPCGGNYTVSHFVFEVKQAQWYMAKNGEEIPGPVGACSPNDTPYASNVITFDTGWWIWDSDCVSSLVTGHPVLVCSGSEGTPCSSPSYHPTVTVKNSKIVGNDANGCSFKTAGGVDSLGPGVIDGGGNTFYLGRTAAGLAPWPALPAIP